MKKTLILTAAFACAAFSANAALVTDSWTTAGGAWVAENQPGFSGGNGTLLSDAGSNGGATLTVSGGSNPNSLFQGAFFYTLFTMPTFTFSADSAASNLSSIVLEIKAANAQAPALTFSNGDAFAGSYTLVVGASEVISSPIGPQTATVFTYTWDVASFDFSNGFDIAFTPSAPHNAFFEINLSQVSAVPEPSTYALILGSVVLGGVAIARRRRA